MARRSSPLGRVTFKQRGAKYGREMQDRVRQWLVDRKALERLIDCYEGKVELTATQKDIGLKIFDKLVPNLQSVEQEVTQNTPFAVVPRALTDAKAWERSVNKPVEEVKGHTDDTKH